jgi:hypothetical protein
MAGELTGGVIALLRFEPVCFSEKAWSTTQRIPATRAAPQGGPDRHHCKAAIAVALGTSFGSLKGSEN